ncbi:MAG: eukaryotic-like serine/threonine-protein kinase [Verrucomicrobiota bacterium]|jgi:serine/threonine protein kinase
MISGEREQHVAELVKSALECPREERTAFLNEACADDPNIRAEVESFLQFQEEASQFIEQGALHVAAQTLAGEPASPLLRQIEGYQIISRVGVGGMGEVYLAQDTKLRRKVALKLVRAGMDTAEIVARFRHEEQILASLNHPNIAQLYGAGIAAGDVPFFAMEYVEGTRIDEYCNAHALPTAARLQLFRKVCAAVHYAHQRLVIHRDLKPSNILVTTNGEPKLLDFGIAKLVEGQDAFTQMQTLPGAMTPDYASPEQIRGDAMTTSSDVYSLGVLLYEILTGQRPYRLKTRSPDEIARAITDQEPERPSTVVARAPNSSFAILHASFPKGDLDNIVLMALRKEPQRRYASVEQFSDDIRRHLEGRPVIAHKDTLAYRATKFVKRQKLAMAATTLILATLIAAIILTSQQKRRAERRFNDVRQLSNALLFEIAPKIERLEGSTDAREALVSRALAYLDSLGEEAGGDPQLQSELATAYEKVGEIQGAPRKPNLSDFSGALLSYGKASKIRQQFLRAKPADFEQRHRLAVNLAATSFIREWTSDITGALEDSKRALGLFEILAADRPDLLDVQLEMAEAKLDLATIHYFNDQTAEVYPPLRMALATLEGLRQSHPENTEVLRLLARAYTDLGMTLYWDGKQKEGEVEMEKAFAVNKPLVASHPKDNVLRQSLLYTYLQASQLHEESNPARSMEILGEALQFAEQSVQSDAANIQARQNLAKTYSMLGVISLHLKNWNDAAAHLEKSFAAFAELEKLDPRNRTYKHDIGRVLMFLGQAKHNQGKFPEALTSYNKAVALFADDAHADPKNLYPLRKLAAVHNYIGETHETAAKTAVSPEERDSHLRDAKQNYRRALELLSDLKGRGASVEKDREFFEKVQAAVRRFGADS